MAIGTPAEEATANDTSAPLAPSANPGSAVTAGKTLFIAVGVRTDDAENGAISASDDVNGAYTEDHEQANSSGGSADRIRISLDRFSNNSEVGTGDAFTASESGGGTQRAAALAAISVTGLDLSPTTLSNGTEAGSDNTPDSGNVTPAAGDWLLMGVSAIRSNTATISAESTGFTGLSTVTANTGTSGSSVVMHAAYRIVTADGLTNYNYQPTWSLTQNSCSLIVAIPEASAGASVPVFQNNYRQRRVACF